jgi:16S rRNA (adenine1518-N6/adenine1519-N6)-dimethyltransferase
VTPQDRVVEIGSGSGGLTFALAQQAHELIAIEYDAELAARLQQALAGQPHVQILHADARHINYTELLVCDTSPPARVKVVANLPYYAAVPILFTLFRHTQAFEDCTLMFQQEVADRITASPGNKSYGPLSVAAQYYSTPEYCFSIPPQAFRPPPQVMSAVITLHIAQTPRVHVHDPEAFFHLVRCAFRSRRKTLINSLSKHCHTHFPTSLVSAALQQLQWPDTIRSERLSLEDFAKLSNLFIDMEHCQRDSILS